LLRLPAPGTSRPSTRALAVARWRPLDGLARYGIGTAERHHTRVTFVNKPDRCLHTTAEQHITSCRWDEPDHAWTPSAVPPALPHHALHRTIPAEPGRDTAAAPPTFITATTHTLSTRRISLLSINAYQRRALPQRYRREHTHTLPRYLTLRGGDRCTRQYTALFAGWPLYICRYLPCSVGCCGTHSPRVSSLAYSACFVTHSTALLPLHGTGRSSRTISNDRP